MKIANRYEVIKEIGSGGMANVYLAKDTILNREVAVKVLKGDMANDQVALRRFEQEANTSTKLSHPNAVDVYDVGEDGNSHFIVMEYVKGHTLKQLIQRRGALPPKEAVWIVKQLAGALLEAHKNGIIHRDIKSQNVLIKDDGTVKLADFGIAILNNSSQLTSKGSVLGSVHYLAPELAKGGSATMQSDIYSLGIVFYELLTGDVPYKGDTPIQVALQHVRNNVPYVRNFNSAIPQSVENIVIKATARSLNERYSNVAFMLKDLNRCMHKEAANDKRLKLESSNATSYKNSNISKANLAAKEISKGKKEKKEKLLTTVFISVISLVSVISIVIILFLTGVIGNKANEYVTVPDISNMSLTVAKDVLSPYGLYIDDTDIEWELTEDVPENQIISYEPSEGTEVTKGTKIKVKVSEGNYKVMADYVGQNIDDVTTKLESEGFTVISNGAESDKDPGTIITQEGVAAGDQYNPSSNNKVYFTYSSYHSTYIELGTLGKSIDEVYNNFVSQGLEVEKIQLSKNDFSDFEVKYGAGNVARMEPNEGSYYSQDGDSSIKLYYFSE